MTAPAIRLPGRSFSKYVARALPASDGLRFWHELGLTAPASFKNHAVGEPDSFGTNPVIASNYATLALASRIISNDFVPDAAGVTYAGVFKRNNATTKGIVGNGTGTTTPAGDTFSQTASQLSFFSSVYTGSAYSNLQVNLAFSVEANDDWLFALATRLGQTGKVFLGRAGSLVSAQATTPFTVTPGPNKVFVGPGFGSQSTHDLAFGAAWDRGISDEEAGDVYAFVKTVMASRGITVE